MIMRQQQSNFQQQIRPPRIKNFNGNRHMTNGFYNGNILYIPSYNQQAIFANANYDNSFLQYPQKNYLNR